MVEELILCHIFNELRAKSNKLQVLKFQKQIVGNLVLVQDIKHRIRDIKHLVQEIKRQVHRIRHQVQDTKSHKAPTWIQVSNPRSKVLDFSLWSQVQVSTMAFKHLNRILTTIQEDFNLIQAQIQGFNLVQTQIQVINLVQTRIPDFNPVQTQIQDFKRIK